MYVVVMGCGRLGSLLASRLSGQGHSVVVIDRDESTFNSLSAEFSGFQIVGEATEMAILREAKVDKADCLLATTDDDNTNLMVAQIGKIIFDVPIVIARVFDPAREETFRGFGVETISPVKLAADSFLEALGAQAGGAD